MLDLACSDAECERAESTVCARVAVAADNRHARLGDTELGADDVHDALARVPHRQEPDAELFAVAPQSLDLLAGHRVGDGAVGVLGRHVVVFGGECQVGPADAAAR